MNNIYQPKIDDQQRKIRKAIDKIRKKTGLDKTTIASRLLSFAVSKISDVFPEMK